MQMDPIRRNGVVLSVRCGERGSQRWRTATSAAVCLPGTVTENGRRLKEKKKEKKKEAEKEEKREDDKDRALMIAVNCVAGRETVRR